MELAKLSIKVIFLVSGDGMLLTVKRKKLGRRDGFKVGR